MLSLCETTDGIFSNLPSSFEGLESKTGRGNRFDTAGGKKWEAERSSRPPQLRSTYLHTTQTQEPSCGSSSAAARAPARPFRPTTGTGPGGVRCAHETYPKLWKEPVTGALPAMVGGVAANSACVFEVNKRGRPMSLPQTPRIEQLKKDPLNSRARSAGWLAQFGVGLREPARGDGKCHQAPIYYRALITKVRSPWPPICARPGGLSRRFIRSRRTTQPP